MFNLPPNDPYYKVNSWIDNLTQLLLLLIPIVYIILFLFTQTKPNIFILVITFLIAFPALIVQDYSKSYKKRNKLDKLLISFSLAYLAICKYLFGLIGIIALYFYITSLNISATYVIIFLLVIISFLLWNILNKLH